MEALAWLRDRARAEVAALVLLLLGVAALQSESFLGQVQLPGVLQQPMRPGTVVQLEKVPARSTTPERPSHHQDAIATPRNHTSRSRQNTNVSTAPSAVRVLQRPQPSLSPATERPKKERPAPASPGNPNVLELPSELMHVVTIGDSLTRYQFMDLVWALHSGSAEPVAESLVWEGAHTSWVSFYEITTSVFGGHMACDCYRSQTIPCFAELCVENRFYKHPTAPLWLTHLQLFGDVPMTARVPLNNSREAKVTGALGALYYTADLPTVLRDHLRYMNPPPTHVVINCGIWGHGGLSAKVPDLVAAARLVTHRFVWKATSLPQCPSNWLPTVAALNDWNAYLNPSRDIDLMMKDHYCGRSKRCHFLAFPGPPQRATTEYYDNVHFKAPVYREWNREMWKLLMVLNNAEPETEAPLVAT